MGEAESVGEAVGAASGLGEAFGDAVGVADAGAFVDVADAALDPPPAT